MTECSQCSQCLVVKPRGDYPSHGKKCKRCVNKNRRLSYQQSMTSISTKRANYRKYWDSNKEVLRAYHREHVKKYRLALRTEVITALGGKCECCEETNKEFLTLEHKNNDGAKHSRALTRGVAPARSDAIYRDVKKLGFPTDRFGILCWNCNSSRGAYGYCPHQIKVVN